MISQILAGLFALGLLTAPATTTPQAPVVPTEKDMTVVTLPNELRRICSCESTGSPNNEPVHFNDDGTVLLGRQNPDDIGACQINVDPEITDWLRIANEHGWDLWKFEDNKRMATWIYDHYGTQPWSWSKHCWKQ